MTDQANLGLVWALTGGTTPVSDAKYQTGWEAEIPTYQNFNWAIQTLDKNLLHFAEENTYDWQDDIQYQPGARVKDNGEFFTCKVASLNNQPSLDTNNNFWVRATLIGSVADFANLLETDGMKIQLPVRSGNTWTGQDMTVFNNIPLIRLSTSGATDNWAVGNMQGEVVVANLGQGSNTDGRNLAKDSGNTFRVFHEGHLPDVSEVVNAVEEAPADDKLYSRKSGNWIEVTTTIVSGTPPPVNQGAGQGWYNLNDGQFYIDIDDGDSQQWVPANVPVIPKPTATNVSYDDSATGLGADLQSATDALYDKIGRKNYIINGDFDIWQRGTSFTNPTLEYTADRWFSSVGNGSGVLSMIKRPTTAVALPGHVSTYLRFQITSLGTSNIVLTQRIEGVRSLGGKTVTLSFYAYGLGSPKFRDILLRQNFGTGGAPSPVVETTLDTDIALAENVWTKHTYTVTLPDTWDKTLGDNGDDYIEVLFRPVVVGVGYTGTFHIAAVQLEEGSVATDFEYRPIAEELALCQRYYLPLSKNNNTPIASGLAQTGTQCRFKIPTPVTMRDVPSISGTTAVIGGGTTQVGAPVPTSVNGNSIYVISAGAGFTTDNVYYLKGDNDVLLDAEL